MQIKAILPMGQNLSNDANKNCFKTQYDCQFSNFICTTNLNSFDFIGFDLISVHFIFIGFHLI